MKHTKKIQFSKGFTIIELLVVISIIMILGFIGMLSLNDYKTNVNNSVRIDTLRNLETSLINNKVDLGYYPMPTNAVNITYSGSLVWSQGTFGKTVVAELYLSRKAIFDPETKNEFTYSITNNRKEFQLAGVIEGNNNIGYNNVYAEKLGGDFNALVVGDYDSEMLGLKILGIDYIISVPSIISTDLSILDLNNIINNNKFVYNGFGNLPYSFKDFYNVGSKLNFSGKKTVLFSGDLSSLNDRTTRLILIENLIESYTGSLILEKNDRIKNIINTKIDKENPSSDLIKLSCDVVESSINYPLKCSDKYFFAFYFDTNSFPGIDFSNIDFSKILGEDIHYIYYDSTTNKLWVGTNKGLSIYDFSTNSWSYKNESNGLSDNDIKEIIKDSSGNIWVATDNGINIYNVASDTWTIINKNNSLLPDEEVLALSEDPLGNVWAGTEDGIGIYNITSDSWSVIDKNNSGLPNNEVTDIIKDTLGNMLVGTEKGLSYYDVNTTTWMTYNKNNSGLQSNDITSILQASTGEYWIGTNNGVSVFDKINNTWVNYDKNNSGLESSHINSIFEYTDGTIWIATDKGLTKYVGGEWFNYTKKDNNLPGNKVYFIFEGQGLIILGTNKGSYILN